MPESGAIIGIDLGTTYSLVATLQHGKAVVLPNGLGELLTPSAVSIGDDGAVLVGAAARARATTHPERTALAFKRDMGTDRVYHLAGHDLRPQELSALVLGALKADAEAALGQPVAEAVVTVPAYFGELQRQATKDAAAIAGLKVERIINEPTAAALAYGLTERHRDLKAVVLDLGGGTFDVTVLEIMEGVIEIRSTAGDARLGGNDFDTALADLVGRRIEQEHRVHPRGDPHAWARLVEASEAAKKWLSTAEEAQVALFNLPLPGGRAVQVETKVTRAEAEAAWASLLDGVRDPIHRALRDAGLSPQAVDEVLLVGGSTRLPCIARLATQVFGKLPLRTLPPDEAVAMGAAVQAGLKAGDTAVEDMVVTDVAPFSLGTAVVTELAGTEVSGVFAPILERGTVIPVSRVRRFSARSDRQTEIRVEVYQGEHSHCRDNQLLGAYTVRGLRGTNGEPDDVDIRFSYDLNGLLEVETTILSSGRKVPHLIERQPGKLSPEQIQLAREALARLKLHPRDALPNATALARADALHVELTGAPRAELARSIAMFRAALESQEPVDIRALRESLVAVTQRLRGSARS